MSIRSQSSLHGTDSLLTPLTLSHQDNSSHTTSNSKYSLLHSIPHSGT
jgi:hypothetical protein